MATKTFYATRDLKNPSYGTRMLKAGDPVELDGPKARLYLALGAVTPKKPKASGGTVSAPKPVVGETPGEQVRATKPATPKKAAPRKRAKK
jgi:hypothetical protein